MKRFYDLRDGCASTERLWILRSKTNSRLYVTYFDLFTYEDDEGVFPSFAYHLSVDIGDALVFNLLELRAFRVFCDKFTFEAVPIEIMLNALGWRVGSK